MSVDWDKPIRMVFEVGGGSEAVRYLGSRKGPESYRRHLVAVDYGEYEAVLFADDCGRINDCCRITNVPQRYARWQNVYESPFGLRASGFFDTRAAAEAAVEKIHLSRLACIRIEFEEGEGL